MGRRGWMAPAPGVGLLKLLTVVSMLEPLLPRYAIPVTRFLPQLCSSSIVHCQISLLRYMERLLRSARTLPSISNAAGLCVEVPANGLSMVAFGFVRSFSNRLEPEKGG